VFELLTQAQLRLYTCMHTAAAAAVERTKGCYAAAYLLTWWVMSPCALDSVLSAALAGLFVREMSETLCNDRTQSPIDLIM